ncbi:MAG: hypothetical protein L6R41_005475 [Letrouitia leprolyta]|nr:MAG: hypothetical protein L6R41_005475 [Letrouitia leprolyta]
MVEQSSFPYDPYISALGDASFPSSSAIESWTADFIGDGIPSSYAFPTDDLSESVIGRTGLEPMAYPYDDFQSTSHVRNDYATSQKPRSFSLNNICGCQQNVLHKLSEISEVNRMDVSVAFDRSLAENKNIISLCTSMVECTNSRHDQDIALMLTGLALITHVITVYDRRFRTRPRSTDDEDKVSPFGSHEYPKDHLPNGLQVQLPENPRHQQQQPPDPTSNVRLSLGSYELDRNDEAILQKSLLRIELSKVGALIASFEKRFCTMDYYNVEGSQDTEPKPLGEVIAHLKKRLMANHEVLANLKHEI